MKRNELDDDDDEDNFGNNEMEEDGNEKKKKNKKDKIVVTTVDTEGYGSDVDGTYVFFNFFVSYFNFLFLRRQTSVFKMSFSRSFP